MGMNVDGSVSPRDISFSQKTSKCKHIRVQSRSENGNVSSPTSVAQDATSEPSRFSINSVVRDDEKSVSTKLNAGDNDNEDDSDDERVGDEGAFIAINKVLNAITKADVDWFKAQDEAKLLASSVNGFQENRTKLNKQQRQDLKKEIFDKHEVLNNNKSRSILWIAVECALQAKKDEDKKNIVGKKDKKDASTYEKYLEILEILARVTTDKSEQYVVRYRDPAICSKCCGCCVESSGIEGGLLHRAAQEDNDDILEILLENGFGVEKEDTGGWTAYAYAYWFKATNAEICLLSHSAKKVFPQCTCCYPKGE